MFHRWRANLRILSIEEIKSTPYVPISHPFIERLIGTIRRKYFDHVLFWTATDLERKLDAFKDYYNGHRVHASLDDKTPDQFSTGAVPDPSSFRGNNIAAGCSRHRWRHDREFARHTVF